MNGAIATLAGRRGPLPGMDILAAGEEGLEAYTVGVAGGRLGRFLLSRLLIFCGAGAACQSLCTFGGEAVLSGLIEGLPDFRLRILIAKDGDIESEPILAGPGRFGANAGEDRRPVPYRRVRDSAERAGRRRRGRWDHRAGRAETRGRRGAAVRRLRRGGPNRHGRSEPRARRRRLQYRRRGQGRRRCGGGSGVETKRSSGMVEVSSVRLRNGTKGAKSVPML